MLVAHASRAVTGAGISAASVLRRGTFTTIRHLWNQCRGSGSIHGVMVMNAKRGGGHHAGDNGRIGIRQILLMVRCM